MRNASCECGQEIVDKDKERKRDRTMIAEQETWETVFYIFLSLFD